METTLLLNKMETTIGNPINYYLIDGDIKVDMNALIGKEIHILFTGEIYCIKCGKKTSKSFGQGYCYPCFMSSPENEDCVLRPELCRAHEGIARDMEYASNHCLKDHFVYLAASSAIKVGVTRMSQIPTRWIDQGASSAIKIACTPNRYTAGLIEVALKKHMPDKTNWRLMLTNRIEENPAYNQNLELVKNVLPENLHQFLLQNEEIIHLKYPVEKYPLKVESVDLLKTPEIIGNIIGIKGQYLLLANGRVLNIRKHAGFKVKIKFEHV
jgi:hypothetical protein